MVYLNYHVDDSILIGRDKSLIDAMITNLSLELEITREGDLASFLGIQIDRSSLSYWFPQVNTTGTYHMDLRNYWSCLQVFLVPYFCNTRTFRY